VFLDALVKDKKSNVPVSNLTTENFQVLDDGKPRPISYFTREGQARKPLAMVLILDLREDGAGRFLKRAEVIKSMGDELAKLPPGDEVAILAMNSFEDEKRFWVMEFTNDRAKIAAALARVQALCEKNENFPHASEQTATGTDDKGVVETETIKGKSGGVVTRTTRKDGSVDVKRVNKDGDVTIEINGVYDIAAAVKDATHKAEELRPNSQPSVVWVSDGIAPIFFEDRDATEQVLIRHNVIFNSLTVDLRTCIQVLMPIGKPLAGWLGVSLYGSAKYLAQQSGGEAIKAGKPKTTAPGSRASSAISPRVTVSASHSRKARDDGRLHSLEVRVNAKDEKARARKLLVSSRQGTTCPVAMPKEASVRARSNSILDLDRISVLRTRVSQPRSLRSPRSPEARRCPRSRKALSPLSSPKKL
jgi:VWFA-related protein